MKQLLTLTTFLSSLMMTTVAMAEWTEVVENVNGSRSLHQCQGLMVK